MDIRQNVQLQHRNTLRLEAVAAWFCEIATTEELQEAVAFANRLQLPVIPLGEGSNLVVTGSINGLVISNRLQGVTIDQSVVTAAGGENWHNLVERTLDENLPGLENLALIPGSVGAAPVQNIGAYGVELSERFRHLTALHLPTGSFRQFNLEDCEFSYRDSLFRRTQEWMITEVSLDLSSKPTLVTSYPGIDEYLAQHKLAPSPSTVFQAVIAIRRQKLPDPSVMPNVGSFFKNPILPSQQANVLKSIHPGMPLHDVKGGAKLSAAWLIDHLGLKGCSVGDFCISDQHALVIINRRAGTADQLRELVSLVRSRVEDAFGIVLEIEPRIYPVGSL